MKFFLLLPLTHLFSFHRPTRFEPSTRRTRLCDYGFCWSPKSKSFVRIRMCSEKASLWNGYGGIESRETNSDFVEVIGIGSRKDVVFYFCLNSPFSYLRCVLGSAVAIKAGLTKKIDCDATVGIHPSAVEEFVTIRTPIRKIRKRQSFEGKLGSEVKIAEGV